MARAGPFTGVAAGGTYAEYTAVGDMLEGGKEERNEEMKPSPKMKIGRDTVESSNSESFFFLFHILFSIADNPIRRLILGAMTHHSNST